MVDLAAALTNKLTVLANTHTVAQGIFSTSFITAMIYFKAKGKITLPTDIQGLSHRYAHKDIHSLKGWMCLSVRSQSHQPPH